MPPALHFAALALHGYVRFGQMQLPAFGLVATAGLIAALALSQRTAAPAGVDPDHLWDAGIVAVLSAFLASRLLLAAVNLRLFLAHPLLVLAQPSLTPGGLAVTAAVVWLWLRRQHLPLRRVLDAWAAPATLLAAILQLGHFLEGTDAGMPTTLPWGVPAHSGLPYARVHPVQLYAAGAYGLLCIAILRRTRRRGSRLAGELAALGLGAGGTITYGLDFLRQPYEDLGGAWLDPAQWLALTALLVGTGMWIFFLRRRGRVHTLADGFAERAARIQSLVGPTGPSTATATEEIHHGI